MCKLLVLDFIWEGVSSSSIGRSTNQKMKLGFTEKRKGKGRVWVPQKKLSVFLLVKLTLHSKRLYQVYNFNFSLFFIFISFEVDIDRVKQDFLAANFHINY